MLDLIQQAVKEVNETEIAQIQEKCNQVFNETDISTYAIRC